MLQLITLTRCELLSEFSTFGISNNGLGNVNNTSDGCELLSEFSTFGISNNCSGKWPIIQAVVNCFQNLVPLVSATTLAQNFRGLSPL